MPGITDIVRTILIICAYAFDVFIGLLYLGVVIYYIRKIPELPELWMPEYYNAKRHAAIRNGNSTWSYYRECWKFMNRTEKSKARQDRFATVLAYTGFLFAIIIVGLFLVRVLFPATIDLAKHI
ncbi:hypothetical protein IJF89_00700 [Candidatus Saccharibacteria bacterium]|nr:hypothetical protein [Candidatus Saccharibacteria bacterium]